MIKKSQIFCALTLFSCNNEHGHKISVKQTWKRGRAPIQPLRPHCVVLMAAICPVKLDHKGHFHFDNLLSKYRFVYVCEGLCVAESTSFSVCAVSLFFISAEGFKASNALSWLGTSDIFITSLPL